VGLLKHPQSNADSIDHGRFEIGQGWDYLPLHSEVALVHLGCSPDNDQLLVVLHRQGPERIRQRGRRQQHRNEEHVGPRGTTFYMRFTIRSDKHNKGSHKLSKSWFIVVWRSTGLTVCLAWRNYMIQQEYWVRS
jgi:hypothetical protein